MDVYTRTRTSILLFSTANFYIINSYKDVKRISSSIISLVEGWIVVEIKFQLN